MLGLTIVVASIAVADSINPSTAIPALWLATTPSAGRLASFILGVFAVYLTGGLVLLFGPGRVMMSALHGAHGPLEHIIETVVGAMVVAFAVCLWCSRKRSRSRTDAESSPRISQTPASAFALGAGIMAIELPTAFMYFGAISAILAARPAAPFEISLVTMYNALFVAPLVAFLAVRHLARAPTERWIRSAEAHVRHIGQVALCGVAGLAGTALLAIGLSGLLVI